MRKWKAAFGVLFLFITTTTIRAQDADTKDDKADSPPAVGPKLGAEHVQKWKIGVVVTSVGGSMSRKTASTTMPTDWPEQTIKIVGQDVSKGVTLGYRSYDTAKQLLVSIPHLAADQEAHGSVIVEVTRHTLLAPDKTDQFTRPDSKGMPGDMKQYLKPSPTIESMHPKVKAIANEIAAQSKAAKQSDWQHVRAIYDWVRAHIKYKARDGGKYESESSASSCVVAIENGSGNCNELTSTFVALCRASGIPARTVRIPGHCYPEFYLEESPTHGGWFPAEASGSDSFGGIFTSSPILQKGDAFKVSMPDATATRPRMKTDVYRFLPETLTGTSGPGDTGQPKLKLICEPVNE